ncbi:class III lanthipeptide [Inconstantimicrobium mannanitabidum]|nr:class III lanthipeptide [Clostridium sp. TW13]
MKNILNLQAMAPITGDQVEDWSTVSNACNNKGRVIEQ